MNNKIPWDLFISHLKKETTQEEEKTLSQWRECPGNEDIYKEISDLWQEIIQNSTSYNPDTNHYWSILESRIERMEKKKVKLSIPLTKIRIAVAAASVLLIIAVSFSYLIGKNSSEEEVSTQTYKAVNGKSEMVLPDGSTVWLNKGSEITFETSFSKNRIVELSGEALFDVKKEKGNPFVVSADNIKIEVKGTRFNVQAYPQENDIRIALLEGNVSVLSKDDLIEMIPGEIAFFNRTSQQLSLENGDVGFEAFWADRSYYFHDKSLRYICKYLERWYNIEIDVDPAIADSQVYRFTITDEPLEIMLQIMSTINPIRYSFENEKKVSIKSVQKIK